MSVLPASRDRAEDRQAKVAPNPTVVRDAQEQRAPLTVNVLEVAFGIELAILPYGLIASFLFPSWMAKARFEWDPKKDEENQSKHSVSFAEAQLAFVDPLRVIAEDLSHG